MSQGKEVSSVGKVAGLQSLDVRFDFWNFLKFSSILQEFTQKLALFNLEKLKLYISAKAC